MFSHCSDTIDVAHLGEHIINEAQSGHIYVEYGSHTLTPDYKRTRMTQTVICRQGSMAHNLQCGMLFVGLILYL